MWTLAVILYLLGAVSAGRDTVPVFILDFEKVLAHVNVEPNPFTEMKTADFGKIVDSAIKLSAVVIVFVEESFCFEDISLKDEYGTPFYHLRQSLKENQVKFLPSVSQPFGTLKEKLHHLDFNIFYIDDSNAKLKMYDRKLSHFYVYFKDRVNETRADALRRHDQKMREIYFVVRQIAKTPIVAFYTGKNNPIAVENLNFRPVKTYQVQPHIGVTIASSGALFKFVGIYATIGSRRSMLSQIPLVAEESWEENHLIIRMAYTDFELEFNFDFKKERWIIENVMLLERGEEVGRTELRVGAPWSWSYTCSDPLVLVNLRDGSSVTISHYQVQPFKDINLQDAIQERSNITMAETEYRNHGDNNEPGYKIIKSKTSDTNNNNTNVNKMKNDKNYNNTNNRRNFGPAVDCGPYFNAHILAGLMVTSFILSILIYGVVSLFNCQSNDRYDDPHGKPLVIAFEGGTS